MYDIIVIGAGPAGLTAAVYGRRAGKSVLILERSTFGGQVTYSPKIENFPAYVSVSGAELADKMVEQALFQGADIEMETVKAVEKTENGFKVITEGEVYEGLSVIIAVGVRHRLLGLDRETDFIGNGISFCAVCDGAFYEKGTVAVIGGGNSALQEALMLSEICAKVYVVQNLATLTGEESLREQLYAKSNVEVIVNTVVKSLDGEDSLRAIQIENTENGEERTLEIDGMFVAIGLVPENDIYKDFVQLDRGYIVSDEGCKTATEGIYTAGDCRTKTVRQIATAVADGASAALAACAYIDNLK